MFQLPIFKKQQTRTKDEEAVDNAKPKRERRKKEPEKPWTLKDRLIVGGVLGATILLAVYFWFRGNGQVPDGTWLQLNFSWPSFEEKIILE